MRINYYPHTHSEKFDVTSLWVRLHLLPRYLVAQRLQYISSHIFPSRPLSNMAKPLESPLYLSEQTEYDFGPASASFHNLRCLFLI